MIHIISTLTLILVIFYHITVMNKTGPLFASDISSHLVAVYSGGEVEEVGYMVFVLGIILFSQNIFWMSNIQY